jgi:hypothetical protein
MARRIIVQKDGMRQSYTEVAPQGDAASQSEGARPSPAAPPRIRPTWVWVIALLTWYGSLYGAVTELRMMLGFVPVPVSLQQYVAGLTPLDHVIALALGAMWCVGATLLWMLRRQSLWWFLVTFFLGGIDFARHAATRGIIGAFASLGAIGAVLAGFVFVAKPVIAAAILAYVVSLYRRGALA